MSNSRGTVKDAIEKFTDSHPAWRGEEFLGGSLSLVRESDGLALYSYNTCIARRWGSKVWATRERFSVTTSKQQTWLLGALIRSGLTVHIWPKDPVTFANFAVHEDEILEKGQAPM
jgi:hypothetical protein